MTRFVPNHNFIVPKIILSIMVRILLHGRVISIPVNVHSLGCGIPSILSDTIKRLPYHLIKFCWGNRCLLRSDCYCKGCLRRRRIRTSVIWCILRMEAILYHKRDNRDHNENNNKKHNRKGIPGSRKTKKKSLACVRRIVHLSSLLFIKTTHCYLHTCFGFVAFGC